MIIEIIIAFILGHVSCLSILMAIAVRQRGKKKSRHRQNSIENVGETTIAVLQNEKEGSRYVN